MQIRNDRRALHQIPELDKDLPKTIAYLKAGLEGLGCRVFSPMEGALCAYFDFGRETALAFRADMDALPVTERNDTDYVSTHPGQAHACGHDGHMAILLELARRLSKKASLPHNVLLVFQPAEETTGGAKDLCETGVFHQYRVEAIFGLHLWPGLTSGVIASRAEELMARSCEVDVTVFGKAAHIAKASEGLDALAAAAAFYTRAVKMEQALPPHIFRLLKFGKLECGSVRNVIADRARLEGSLRAFQDDVFFSLQQGLLDIGKNVELETGCRVEVKMNSGYPAVLNPRPLYDRVKACLDFVSLDAPYMTAEDFSFYQRYLPGMFFFLGVGDTPALHAENFDFREEVLLKGADFFEKLAEVFL